MQKVRRVAAFLFSLFLRVACFVCVIGISWICVILAKQPNARLWLDPAFMKAWLRVGEGMRLVGANYLEPGAVTPEKLAVRALAGVGGGLDRYSAYLPVPEFEEFNQRNDQTYTGIGAEFQILDGRVVIVRVHPGGGAVESGVNPGDRILKIEGVETDSSSAEKVAACLRGEEGKGVNLELWRVGTGVFARRVMFRKTRVPSVDDIRVLDDGTTGYLRIVEFKRHTAAEVAAALEELKARGVRRTVLDLRDNPGGTIEAAVDIVGLFCPKGTVAVTLRGRGGKEQARYVTKYEPIEPRLPLAVLVNRVTASSAEIVSGALQDLKRAVVVGEATRGKHVAQTVHELSGGDALRVTTARYTLPSGRSIEGGGVRPDVEQAADWRERRLVRLGAIFREAGAAAEFSRLHGGPPPEDVQLLAAIDVLSVFGAGNVR
jgi:carboxyl-terminal processing protease